MLYNTEAIVIRSIRYGETNAIVTLITPAGTVSAMARGAKKPQSRLAACVQLCAQGIYHLYQGSGMGNIQQAELMQSRRALHEDIELAAYAAYFCELIGTVAEERPNGSEAVFHLLENGLDRLVAQPEEVTLTALMWDAKILHLLGASPDWSHCVNCHESLVDASGTDTVFYSPYAGGLLCDRCGAQRRQSESMRAVPRATPAILAAFVKTPWTRVGRVRLSEPVQVAIHAVLRNQMVEFGGLAPKSMKFLDDLKSDFNLDLNPGL